MRATPLILQLIYIYYVLPTAGIKLNPLVAAITGLTLHYSAYLSEVFRGGIQSIAKGQTEAAFEPWFVALARFPQGGAAAGNACHPTHTRQLPDLTGSRTPRSPPS